MQNKVKTEVMLSAVSGNETTPKCYKPQYTMLNECSKVSNVMYHFANLETINTHAVEANGLARSIISVYASGIDMCFCQSEQGE